MTTLQVGNMLQRAFQHHVFCSIQLLWICPHLPTIQHTFIKSKIPYEPPPAFSPACPLQPLFQFSCHFHKVQPLLSAPRSFTIFNFGRRRLGTTLLLVVAKPVDWQRKSSTVDTKLNYENYTRKDCHFPVLPSSPDNPSCPVLKPFLPSFSAFWFTSENIVWCTLCISPHVCTIRSF